jgi:hypothetical protein
MLFLLPNPSLFGDFCHLVSDEVNWHCRDLPAGRKVLLEVVLREVFFSLG